MNPCDYRMAQAYITLRLNEAKHTAKTRALLHQAEKVRQRRLARQRGWLLYQLGRLLITWGKQLKQLGMPRPLSHEGQIHQS